MDILISANFTCSPIYKFLTEIIKKTNKNFNIWEGQYNQVFQQLLGNNNVHNIDNSEIRFNVVLLKLDEMVNQHYYMQKLCEVIEEQLQKELTYHLLVFICPACTEVNYNNLRIRFEEFNLQYRNFHFSDLNNAYNAKNIFTKQSNKLGDIPYSDKFFAQLAICVFRKISSILGYPYKVLVLDCDGTLWNGIVGEIGLNKITLTKGKKYLQKFIVEQYNSGKLICLCSKNNLEDVMAVFDKREDMILTKRHISEFYINWNRKSDNIKKISQKLNLGLDTFVFIDDNPTECAEVKIECPEVTVLNLPEDKKIKDFLNNLWIFDCESKTIEDSMRTMYYKDNAKREELKENFQTLEDYVNWLEIKVCIEEAKETEYQRIIQLSERVNQFNMNGKKISYFELKSLEKNKCFCATVKVNDKIGNYGLVGVLVYKYQNNCLLVKNWFLSCRALGKNIEHSMLLYLKSQCERKGIFNIEIEYFNTGKNEPFSLFLSSEKIENNFIRIKDIKSKIPILQAHSNKYTYNNQNKGKNEIVFWGLSANELYRELEVDNNLNVNELVYNVLKNVMTLEEDETDTNLFLFGLDSLKAIRIAEHFYSIYNIELSLADIYENATIEKLTALVSRKMQTKLSTKKLPDLCHREIKEGLEYPLSCVQESLLTFELQNPDTNIYNMPYWVELSGPIDLEALNYAFNCVINRHEMFKVEFGRNQVQLYQKFVKEVFISINEECVSDIDKVIKEEENKKIPIDKAPLLRVRLIKIKYNKYLMGVTVHHLIFDGGSYFIFFKDLSQYYNDFLDMKQNSSLKAKNDNFNFLDFINWELECSKKDIIYSQIDYWKKELKNLKSVSIIPYDIPSNNLKSKGLYIPVEINLIFSQKLIELCSKLKVSLFNGLLTIYHILAMMLTNVYDIPIGTIVSTRRLHQFDNIIGPFINAVVIRNVFGNDDTFEQMVLMTKDKSIKAFENKDISFGEIINSLSVNYDFKGKSNPFYDMVFLFQNVPMPIFSMKNLEIKKYKQGYNIARENLILELTCKDKLIFGGIYFNNNIYKVETIKRLIDGFVKILKMVITQPQIKLKEIRKKFN